MIHPSLTRVLDQLAVPAWFRPGLPLLLGTCGVVATAGVLGMEAVRATVLGVPAGLWLVGLVQGSAWWLSRRNPPLVDSLHGVAAPPAADAAATPLLDRATSAGAEVLSLSAEVIGKGAEALGLDERDLGGWSRRAADRLDASSFRAVPLRVGVALPPDQEKILRAACDVQELRIEWMRCSPIAAGPELQRLNLDACVLPHGPGVRVRTTEAVAREAAWFDWAAPRPLTFPAVFPLRLDCARLEIERVEWASPEEAEVLGMLVASAAALSRTPARLGVMDRLRGRMPAMGQPDDAAEREPMRACAEHALDELARRVTKHDLMPSSLVGRAAARVVTAWASSTQSRAELGERRRWAEAGLVLAGDEAEVVLRAMAVRIASGDETGGLAPLSRVRHLCAGRDTHAAEEHLAFVQAELELGAAHPLALGRIAAGLALAGACAEPERLPFIRGDILDDARFVGWLVGRDQDRALLMEIFRRLDPRAPIVLAGDDDDQPVAEHAARPAATHGTRPAGSSSRSAPPALGISSLGHDADEHEIRLRRPESTTEAGGDASQDAAHDAARVRENELAARRARALARKNGKGGKSRGNRRRAA